MAEESQYCNSRELYEARMKNYDDNIKTHEWTRTHTGAKTFRWQSLQHIYFSRSHQNSPAELVKTETRRRRACKEGELPVVLSWSCQEGRDWRGSTSTKGLSRQSSSWPTMGDVSISRYWRNNQRIWWIWQTTNRGSSWNARISPSSQPVFLWLRMTHHSGDSRLRERIYKILASWDTTITSVILMSMHVAWRPM